VCPRNPVHDLVRLYSIWNTRIDLQAGTEAQYRANQTEAFNMPWARSDDPPPQVWSSGRGIELPVAAMLLAHRNLRAVEPTARPYWHF
jgi:hypothetical protein